MSRGPGPSHLAAHVNKETGCGAGMILARDEFRGHLFPKHKKPVSKSNYNVRPITKLVDWPLNNLHAGCSSCKCFCLKV